MRLLFVNEKCGYFGGVEQNIAHTVEGLTARGHECQLAFTSVTDREPDVYRALFSDTHRFDDSASQQEVRKLVEAAAPDAIYLHKVQRVEPWIAAAQGRRVVRMVHDHDLCCPRRHKYFAHSGRVCRCGAGWRCWMDGAFLERSSGPLPVRYASIGAKLREMRRNRHLDALLVGSRFMQDELLTNGFPRERVHILPPVVRMQEIDTGPVPEDPNVLCVGQLIRGKGMDLLLHAAAEIRRPFTLRIAGTGNALAKLEALRDELGLGGRVEFTGWVPPAETGALYEAAKVVVVPSRWPEPFGMVGLEAMWRGRPVVAFAVGGIPDWLEDGDTGFLVDEQDTGAMARRLELLLDDTEMARALGANARERVRQRFSFDGYLDELEMHLSRREALVTEA